MLQRKDIFNGLMVQQEEYDHGRIEREEKEGELTEVKERTKITSTQGLKTKMI